MAVIYRFARTADDFADEGNVPASERLSALDHYRSELRRLESGRGLSPLFAELRQVVRDYGLPLDPFHDLLDAFSQDVTKQRYSTFSELMDYCRRSANPIGRLMLLLYGRSGEKELAWSDAICTALQLINFWQDVDSDFRRNRVYLPQDDMAQFGVTEAQIAAHDTRGGWWGLMRFQIDRSRRLMMRGAPLATRLPGRIGLEMRAVVQGGLMILDKLERIQGDVFRRRPLLRAWDWPLLLARAMVM